MSNNRVYADENQASLGDVVGEPVPLFFCIPSRPSRPAPTAPARLDPTQDTSGIGGILPGAIGYDVDRGWGGPLGNHD